MSPRKVDKQAKREKILRAAMRVFSRRGARDFRMIEIAEEASVGKGTLYEYFRTKDELVAGCFELFLNDFDYSMRAGLPSNLSPSQQICEYIRLSAEYFASHRQRMTLLFDLWAMACLRSERPPDLPDLRSSYGAAVRFIASIIEAGIAAGELRTVDSRAAASALLAMLDGLLFQVHLGMADPSDKQFVEKTCELIMEGLKA